MKPKAGNIMMKKISAISLLCLFFVFACSSPVVKRNFKTKEEGKKGLGYQNSAAMFSDSVRKKVALLAFFNEAPYGGDDLAIITTQELTNELGRTKEFILDNVANKTFGTSKEIYVGGGEKLAQMSREAKINGVNFVMYGRILDARIREKADEIGLVRKVKAYTETSLEVRIFDISSNKEIFTEIVKGYADDSTYRFFRTEREGQLDYRRNLLRYSAKIAARKIIPKVVEVAAKYDWVGRVAKIISNKIFINAGRLSGINVGDVLKVMTEGTEIYDPETGALIGVSKGHVKGTIEVIDYFGEDGSVAILHSGGSVLEGDYVQLY